MCVRNFIYSTLTQPSFILFWVHWTLHIISRGCVCVFGSPLLFWGRAEQQMKGRDFSGLSIQFSTDPNSISWTSRGYYKGTWTVKHWCIVSCIKKHSKVIWGHQSKLQWNPTLFISHLLQSALQSDLWRSNNGRDILLLTGRNRGQRTWLLPLFPPEIGAAL